MHETLLSKEEFMGAEDLGEYYRVPADNRDLNYDKYYSKGSTKVELEVYNSYNTHRLSETELKELLAQIDIK
jgi:UDP-glucose 4-epimerase